MLGLRLAVEPKISPSSLIPSPHVLLLVERMNSRSVTVGGSVCDSLKRQKP